METQTHDGRRIRLMTLIDEFTRKCLAIRIARRINAIGVIETLQLQYCVRLLSIVGTSIQMVATETCCPKENSLWQKVSFCVS